MLTILAAALLDAATLADPFNPADYLQRQPAMEVPLSSEVLVGGRPFIKFRSSAGAIYLPKVLDLSKADLERALCVPQAAKPKCDLGKRSSWAENADNSLRLADECRDDGTAGTTVLRAETPLENRTAAYADLILLAIQAKCGDAERPNASLDASPGVELGVERKAAGRRPGGEKVFVRPGEVKNPAEKTGHSEGLKPQAGFGLSF